MGKDLQLLVMGFEALAISEVLHLLETESIDTMLIASDVNKD